MVEVMNSPRRAGKKTSGLVVLGFLLLSACTPWFTRTVYVPDGKAVRLRETINAKIWALDHNGEPVPGRMDLPEGWYVLPDPVEKTQ